MAEGLKVEEQMQRERFGARFQIVRAHVISAFSICRSAFALAMCASAAYIILVPVNPTEQKSERFVARVTRDDKQLFHQAACLEGRSMATFVIAHARQAAEEIIARRNVIRLNAKDSRRFVEALLAPPEPPTPRMLESIRLYRKRVKSDLD